MLTTNFDIMMNSYAIQENDAVTNANITSSLVVEIYYSEVTKGTCTIVLYYYYIVLLHNICSCTFILYQSLISYTIVLSVMMIQMHPMRTLPVH